MHILATSSVSLDDAAEPVDLQQSAADVAFLSFTDSDLSVVARIWEQTGNTLPTLRLARLRDLKHPMSVDLWVDKVAQYAKVIIVRILGGYDWWAYGCDELNKIAHGNNIKLFLLPGEDQEDDQRLIDLSTAPCDQRNFVLRALREGGDNNIQILVSSLQEWVQGKNSNKSDNILPIPKYGFYHEEAGIIDKTCLKNYLNKNDIPLITIIFYRSMLMAADIEPVKKLSVQLQDKGFQTALIFVNSLKDQEAVSFIEKFSDDFNPSVFVTTTAFSCDLGKDGKTLFERLDRPVFQVILATTPLLVWQESQRGLNPSDLAMHVVLPELDGRILAGALSFKSQCSRHDLFQFQLSVNKTDDAQMGLCVERILSFIKLQKEPNSSKRLVILIPDYPGANGRKGYAVGLDVFQSVIALLHDLKEEGYHIQNIPKTSRELMELLEKPSIGISLEYYEMLRSEKPPFIYEKMNQQWGRAQKDQDCLNYEGEDFFFFKKAHFGHVTVSFAPDRSHYETRRSDYHDPIIPPRHSLVAFGLWMKNILEVHAIVHFGAHGTLEWLPGKNIALTPYCFPELVTGGLPVIYPFIVSNPGEAAVAKRRIAAVTLGHMPPNIMSNTLSENQQKLERLVDEYAQADGLDRRRRDKLADLILKTAYETGLAQDVGLYEYEDSDQALARIDSWLCDLKDFSYKDGHHIYGRAASNEENSLRLLSVKNEKDALLKALEGKFIVPGPSGAPARGRQDVLPTGRNLYTSDPRTMPTPTAYDLGRQAADEVMRRYIQDHGEPPKQLVMDLWGSASLRTGGEEIAQALALIGCRPVWDFSTGRVTGVEVLPDAVLPWSRVDVTFRISGLFRDMFSSLIALLDSAIQSIALINSNSDEAPHNKTAKTQRIFGPQPGCYGAGIEDLLTSGLWQEREELGQHYLDSGNYAYGGAEGEGVEALHVFEDHVRNADALVHISDDPGRDLLEGSADVAFIGGFASAVALLKGNADIITLDITEPSRPRARSVSEALIRIIHGRVLNQNFIETQMKYGPRGAVEFVETVDRIVSFSETTKAVPSHLIEAVFDAYLKDERVREFLLQEYPEAAETIIRRFMDARRRDLWRSRRNTIDADLDDFLAEAAIKKGEAYERI